ncbi:MBL fold metallo-hydrolase [Rudanella paleaurantiibacter]|uniref:MBL fold metallo-hydrolase n=1 Tax=Rudanella paleaurantiibacter TaxID=2614655 RepID=A0A7J5U1G8_9BACT|nr:MBL fold metallo-hydrolase [Rudanella paleaurantiibacter]KAB7730440.1 MBL fold metallo-hydrolase [Rudanella paleaurantiibacter]
MSLFISSLNSGSNGNCYYVGNHQEAVLIDAGISCRETERRMDRLGLSMKTVKAIFISHEHSDHIVGVDRLARKYKLPVYITPGTLRNTRLSESAITFQPLRGYEPVLVGDLSVTAFPKQHDAADPHSFLVSFGGINVGVFTDIGTPCTHVIDHFKQCHAAFLEANYDDDLLALGRYPYFLKQRISGDNGHLSNRQALDLFLNHRPVHMSHLLLAHLSRDNNSPQVVANLFAPHLAHTQLVVASRYAETAVYQVSGVMK